ncbi:hypothetical protein [Rhabdochromatium marinum]|uniref:hypothetical protein n=1 Tax=Rhabdochromatium marinum TaxID=48729 RepID=UPI0019087FA6|nr:hypothetical protein [Rhabdochromatium marinum]
MKQVKAHGLACFRLGDHILREPDYRQLLDWADHYGMEPEVFTYHLARSQKEPDCFGHREPIGFEIVAGAIHSLVWDIKQFGVIPPRWREGVSVRKLALIGDWSMAVPLELPPIPGLTELYCCNNQFTELNLSPMPGLVKLTCGRSQLTQLVLSSAPNLTALYCDHALHIINPPASLKVIRG